VVTHTGEILNTSASDENNGVLLKVMADTGDISRNFRSVCEPYSCDLSHSGVRLLGGSCSYRGANASLLGSALVDSDLLLGVVALLKRRSRGFLFKNRSSLAYKLVKGWHNISPFFKYYMKTQIGTKPSDVNTPKHYTHKKTVCQAF
jgi:hypothetical protein